MRLETHEDKVKHGGASLRIMSAFHRRCRREHSARIAIGEPPAMRPGDSFSRCVLWHSVSGVTRSSRRCGREFESVCALGLERCSFCLLWLLPARLGLPGSAGEAGDDVIPRDPASRANEIDSADARSAGSHCKQDSSTINGEKPATSPQEHMDATSSSDGRWQDFTSWD